jgi:nucleotide-binding universal stress UspA family protein
MNVLIPVDASELSLETIKEAAALLDRQAALIHLLTVMVPVTAEVPWGFYVADEREEADAILRKSENTAREAGLQVVRIDAVMFQDPATAICDYAAKENVDLIVMGSHGYSGVTKALIGSVSEAVFQHAKAPVMIIRHDKTRSMEVSHADRIHLKPLS